VSSFLTAYQHKLPKGWRRQLEKTSMSIGLLEADLQPFNHGLNSAWRPKTVEATSANVYDPRNGMVF